MIRNKGKIHFTIGMKVTKEIGLISKISLKSIKTIQLKKVQILPFNTKFSTLMNLS